MTIDEAIKELKNSNYLTNSEELQIAEWLEELKAFRENKWTDIYIKRGYDKAIDDFVNACKEDILCQTFGLHIKGIERIAEQLKAGGKNAN